MIYFGPSFVLTKVARLQVVKYTGRAKNIAGSSLYGALGTILREVHKDGKLTFYVIKTLIGDLVTAHPENILRLERFIYLRATPKHKAGRTIFLVRPDKKDSWMTDGVGVFVVANRDMAPEGAII